jgi:hypothetical protein
LPQGQAADPPGLERRRGPVADELPGQDPRLRQRALAQVGASGLEQGDPLGAVGAVVAGGVEQGPDQRRALDGMLAREGVRDPDRLCAQIAVRDPKPSWQAWIGEAEVDDRVEAEVAQRVLRAPAQALLTGQPPGLAAGRGQRRDQVLRIAVDTTDLLDQVDLPCDVVVAVDRHRDLQVVPIALYAEVEPLEVLRALIRRDRHAEQSLDPFVAEPDLVRLGHLGCHVDRAGDELRPAELHHQSRGDPLRAQGKLRMELLLIPV